MYKKPLTGITSMHLGQAGLDLNNVYLKYHSCALTASSYIMNKFIPSQITGFYNFFSRSRRHLLVEFGITMELFEHVPYSCYTITVAYRPIYIAAECDMNNRPSIYFDDTTPDMMLNCVSIHFNSHITVCF